MKKIKLLSNIIHLGLSSELQQFRNDELIRFVQHKYYNAGWQAYRSLEVPINLRQTDKLVLFCDYNTVRENKSYTVNNTK